MIHSSALFGISGRRLIPFAIVIALTSWDIQASAPLFRPAVSYPAGGGATESVVAADVNGDGYADLVVAIQNDPGGADLSNGLVGVLLGRGDGTYGAPTTYDSAGMEPFSVAVGDLNGDQKADIVIANFCTYIQGTCSRTTLGVLLGRGDGTFEPAIPIALGGNSATSVAVADVNNDGAADILVALLAVASGGPAIEILPGNGDATFRAPVFAAVGGADVRSIVVGDMNGDGAPDIVASGDTWSAASNSTGTVNVLLGNGDGTFQPVVRYLSGALPGGWASSVVLADVNLDGRLDVAVTNYPDSTVGVLLGTGDGGLQAVTLHDSGARFAWSLAAADFDGDGRPDLAVGNASGALGVLLGNGDGTFQTAQTSSLRGVATGIAAADLNHDGRPDVVLTNGDNTVSVLIDGAACDEAPPAITVAATPASLWPATGKTATVTVSGTITRSGCGLDVITAAYAVHDEYGEVHPSGPVTLGAGGHFSFAVSLPASRRGTDFDGRQYTISVQAQTARGHTATATTTVAVSHDRRRTQ